MVRRFIAHFFFAAHLTFDSTQPPKRKAPAQAAPKTRQSKLAKEHNVTAQEEGEIREAFGLFAEPMDGEKNGVLPVDDVKSALMYVSQSFSVMCFLLLANMAPTEPSASPHRHPPNSKNSYLFSTPKTMATRPTSPSSPYAPSSSTLASTTLTRTGLSSRRPSDSSRTDRTGPSRWRICGASRPC